jgi:hypothetical protein
VGDQLCDETSSGGLGQHERLMPLVARFVMLHGSDHDDVILTDVVLTHGARSVGEMEQMGRRLGDRSIEVGGKKHGRLRW